MTIKYAHNLILMASLINLPCFASEREISITIDDLPFVCTDSNNPGNLQRSHDRFMKIMQSLIDNHVPATGFVIAGSIGKGQWLLLEEFRKEGFSLAPPATIDDVVAPETELAPDPEVLSYLDNIEIEKVW